MDGKTLRGSKKRNAKITHLLSIVTHELGITLAPRGVCAKTNEAPVSIKTLKAFDVRGKVVTTDALLTQRAFCEGVAAAGGEYVLPVKANQKALFEAIAAFLSHPAVSPPVRQLLRHLQQHIARGVRHLTRMSVLERGMGTLKGGV